MLTQLKNKIRQETSQNSSIETQAKNAKLMMKADNKKGSLNGKLRNKNSADNDELDLKALIAAERLGGEDMDETFKENLLRLGERYQGTELGVAGVFGNGDGAGIDEEAEIDMSLFKKQNSWLTSNAISDRQLKEATKEHKKQKDTVARCESCIESTTFKNHLIISTAQHTMLKLKTGPGALMKGWGRD
jgi:hypothetical protein